MSKAGLLRKTWVIIYDVIEQYKLGYIGRRQTLPNQYVHLLPYHYQKEDDTDIKARTPPRGQNFSFKTRKTLETINSESYGLL